MMRFPLVLAALLGAATPLLAQEVQAPAPEAAAMTCGEFLALDAGAQRDAMLRLRAEAYGDPVPEPTADAAAAADDPKLSAMRTSCEGAPDVLATDALVAAHADYE